MSGLYLFAYGTLRTGQPNHGMIRPAIIEHVGVTRLSGMRMFAYYGGGFPFITPTGAGMGDSVVGEVFRIQPGAHFADMLAMEVVAGYDVRQRTVVLAGQNTGGIVFDESLEVVVCEFPESDSSLYSCEPVETGDWLDYVNACPRRRHLSGITDTLA
jgi:gamma-glutamylcyclotransferase (GGCT)/AIG2-like uncharacterized protein YtfP